MTGELQVLMVEDCEDDAELVRLELMRGGIRPDIHRVQTADELQNALETGGWDVVLSDFSLPQFSGSAAVDLVREADPVLPIIIVSGAIGEETAVQVMKAGACDYIPKSRMTRLPPAVQRELRDAEVRRRQQAAEEELAMERGLFSALMESRGAIVVVGDTHGAFVRMSKAAEEITGLTVDEVAGIPFWNWLQPEETANILKERFRRILDGESPRAREIVLQDARGKRRTVAWEGAVLRDKGGGVRYVVGTAVEITGLKEAEQELRRLNNQLAHRVVQRTRELEACRATEKELRRRIRGRHGLEDIVSHSPAMERVFDVLPAVAESPSTVLITGESGTGKELVARCIHNLSPRREGPFVALNCGALPDSLLESELFGHKAGAFTDAKKDKAGRFELARGGTLLLDEIGDISEAMQVRLLRVLQERVFQPLGSEEPVQADVRVLASTNRDLEEMVRRDEFRRDLYYRINVVNLELPPLRQRLEDVPLLAAQFIEQTNREQDRSVCGITDAALACLTAHNYPGNVRELENAIAHAFILCGAGPIDTEHLPAAIRGNCPRHDATGSLEQAEAAVLLRTLDANDWNRTQSARDLGIHRTTLLRKMKSLGIEAPEGD